MKLCAIGDNCVDYYPDLNCRFAGGNPINVAVYFKELGGESSYIGRVGDDENGSFLVEEVKRKGVDVSKVQVVPGKTATSQVKLRRGDRDFVEYDPGVSRGFDVIASDLTFIQEHDLIFSGRWGELVDELKALSHMMIAFDLADIYDDELARRVLTYSDIAFVSVPKLNTVEILDLLVSLSSYGPKLTIATRGALGSIVFDRETFYEYRSEPVTPVDSLGAGDSFIAGFLLAYLEGKPIRECQERGANKAIETISHIGAF
ncbi:PfkB family carbohydrate kinase [Guggenheimella bovis]